MFARAVRRRRTCATTYICTPLGCQPIFLALYFKGASTYPFLIRRIIVAHSCDGKSVLIVDDDPEILQAIKLAFEDIGAKIETASDGIAAIDLAIKSKPDLVVLDAMLPKRS